MSDYTPNTEDVRADYGTLWTEGEPFADDAERLAEFDRWLNSVKADAWDEAVAGMVYSDGTPLEIVANNNPYREAAV